MTASGKSLQSGSKASCSVLLTPDGQLVEDDRSDRYYQTDASEPSQSSGFDVIRTGCDDKGGDALANGFTLHNCSMREVSEMVASSDAAMALTHETMSRQLLALKRCSQMISASKKVLSQSLQASTERTTSTPIVQKSSTLGSAMSSYDRYLDVAFANVNGSLSFCEDVVLSRLTTSNKLLQRRMRAREVALARAQADVEELDAKLDRCKREATRKHDFLDGIGAEKDGAFANDYLKLANETRLADNAVDDTAALLLSALSRRDTVAKASRVAGEGCLLSALGSQARFIEDFVKHERLYLKQRLNFLDELEKDVSKIDVRGDLRAQSDKLSESAPSANAQYNVHDGGVAAALSLLDAEHNTGAGDDSSDGSDSVDGDYLHLDCNGLELGLELEHLGSKSGGGAERDAGGGGVGADGVEVSRAPSRSTILLWTKRLFADDNEVLQDSGREKAEEAGEHDHPLREPLSGQDDKLTVEKARDGLISVLVDRTDEMGGSCRKHFLYALNTQRSIKTSLTEPSFVALGEVLKSFLSGCGDGDTAVDVANVKTCMMLSQTFFTGESGRRDDRRYIKGVIADHPIWEQDLFWDQALFQCIAESLHRSGLMSTLLDAAMVEKSRAGYIQRRKGMKWHDLMPQQRFQAASQVQSIVTAQLTALAHSMIEFGIGLGRACRFVRRMSVRYQLAIGERRLLLAHLEELVGAEA